MSAMPKGTLKRSIGVKVTLRKHQNEANPDIILSLKPPIVISGEVKPSEAVNKRILEVDMIHNISGDQS